MYLNTPHISTKLFKVKPHQSGTFGLAGSLAASCGCCERQDTSAFLLETSSGEHPVHVPLVGQMAFTGILLWNWRLVKQSAHVL